LVIVNRGVQNNIPSILEAVVGDAATQAYVPAGDLVFRAGEAPTIALIRAGVVRMFIQTEGGRQYVALPGTGVIVAYAIY